MDLNEIDSIYFSSESDLDKELFLPIVKNSHSIRCMSGYFTSGVFRELSQSFIYFLNHNLSEIRFIVSPNLSEKDLNAIYDAIDVDGNLVPLLFPEFELTEDCFKFRCVEALSYLVATKKLILKIAIKKRGLFHSKCWLFETNSGSIAIHGSINATESAFSDNFEQLAVNKSWESSNSNKVVNKIDEMFENIWHGDMEGIKTISLNKATISYINKIYESLNHNQQIDVSLMNDLEKIVADEELAHSTPKSLKVPNWLNYTSGIFSHQEKAVNAWFENDGRGILSIATGGGKTLTALIAASLLMAKEKSLLVIIAVPTIALIRQWGNDVRDFSVEPLDTQSITTNELGREINGCIRRLRLGTSNCEVIITTHDGLKSNRFINLLSKAKNEISLMLIGDEVHNLGSVGYQNSASDIFKYRLGLSATFERQFDEEGTQFLLDYFGKVVFEFNLENAIGVCLVPFDYHVHLVTLNEEEENEWAELTYEIKRLSYVVDLPDDTNEKERWKLLCLKRRKIVESAEGKVLALAVALPKNRDEIRRTLIFCTDKYPEQLESVNELLISRHINFHQITAEETANKKQLIALINEFDTDNLQVLTSKRVLDEGFNIPQTEMAFLIASNTVKRQWIQRLGRVLRKSPKTNKTKAVIHDFVVMPACDTDSIDIDLKGLIKGELNRLQFFDLLSQNGLEKGGTADVIEQLLELME